MAIPIVRAIGSFATSSGTRSASTLLILSGDVGTRKFLQDFIDRFATLVGRSAAASPGLAAGAISQYHVEILSVYASCCAANSGTTAVTEDWRKIGPITIMHA
jgi:hypothetical protein